MIKIDNKEASTNSETPSTQVVLSEKGKQRSQDYGQALKQPKDGTEAAQEAEKKTR